VVHHDNFRPHFILIVPKIHVARHPPTRRKPLWIVLVRLRSAPHSIDFRGSYRRKNPKSDSRQQASEATGVVSLSLPTLPLLSRSRPKFAVSPTLRTVPRNSGCALAPPRLALWVRAHPSLFAQLCGISVTPKTTRILVYWNHNILGSAPLGSNFARKLCEELTCNYHYRPARRRGPFTSSAWSTMTWSLLISAASCQRTKWLGTHLHIESRSGSSSSEYAPHHAPLIFGAAIAPKILNLTVARKLPKPPESSPPACPPPSPEPVETKVRRLSHAPHHPPRLGFRLRPTPAFAPDSASGCPSLQLSRHRMEAALTQIVAAIHPIGSVPVGHKLRTTNLRKLESEFKISNFYYSITP
jgi:hypothetical protein